MKILAVDDDWMILELLEQAMSVSGQHELTTVTSGETAKLAALMASEAIAPGTSGSES